MRFDLQIRQFHREFVVARSGDPREHSMAISSAMELTPNCIDVLIVLRGR